MQIELLLYAYLTCIVHSSRSLLSQANLQVRELGFCFNKSLGRCWRYGYRCLDVLLTSCFVVQLSRSPLVQGQRLRVILIAIYC